MVVLCFLLLYFFFLDLSQVAAVVGVDADHLDARGADAQELRE